ncbi:MAG: glycogen/starch synthase [Candidatus Dojkabacteria bacterium]
MIEKDLKILQVVGEIYPYSKTGGLGHVTADITYNLADSNNDVTVFTPLYGSVWKMIKKKNVETVLTDIPIYIDSTTTITCSCLKYVKHNGSRKPITFYFINHYDFFGRYSRNLYSSPDMHKRLYFFSKAVVVIIKELGLNFDIVHIHDWMVGLFPKLLKEDFNFSSHKSPKVILTIHNLAFQGSGFLNLHRFEKKFQRPPAQILPPYSNDEKWEKVNFLKQGIKHADMITTVSSTYANEIATPEYGEGLSSFLSKYGPIYGIINGIDYKAFNPATSKNVPENFNTLNFTDKKRKNKLYLIKMLKLPKHFINYPFIITTHRITYQKGYDLILKIFRTLMKMNIVFVVLGDGDKRYVDKFHELNKSYKNFVFITPYSDITEEKLLAGSDILLCPSIYEPCGTAHMKGMRYGVVPVARKTGGLADTISNFDEKKNSGTGFLFLSYDKKYFLNSIKRAIRIHTENKKVWKEIVLRCMNQSFTWEKSIEEYIFLYRKLLKKSKKTKLLKSR